jgi:ABC-type Zn uptake system ZnuABC Zn-binding protein ZnuA
MLTMAFFITANLSAGDKLKIVTSTKPSFMIKLQKADMFVQVGLGLEIGWVPTLLDGARNGDILPGAKGYVDASAGMPLLQVPVGDPATLRARGDIHANGNPHYWLDPLRGKIIAENIFERLKKEKLKPYAGGKIVAFHNSWPYFEERFGLKIVTFIEPKPGIPPTPKHLVEVIKTMTGQEVKVIIISPYYSKKSSELVASNVEGEVVELASSVNAFPEAEDYFELFDYNINQLIEAFNRAGKYLR